jgi:TonB family protein
VLKEIVPIYEIAYGENAPEVVDPLIELARAEVALLPDRGGRLYLSHLREALDVAEGAEGRDSFLYASLALEAGQIVFDQGESLRAKSHLDDAYRAFNGPLKQHSYYAALSGFYLGKYHLARKKYAEAEPYLVNAVHVLSGQTQADTHLELTARAFLVEVYEALGNTGKSSEHSQAIGSMTPFEMGQEPVPLFKGHPPAYPPLALQARREGYAIVGFTISDTGIPEDTHVLETKGSKSFGDAALEYVEKLRFAPRFVDGVAVDTTDRKFRVSFNLAK